MNDVLTPAAAARKIVNDLMPDLPEDRKQAVREAIEARMGAWGDLVGAVAHESGERQ